MCLGALRFIWVVVMKYLLAVICLFPFTGFADPLPKENACEIKVKHRVQPEYPIAAARLRVPGWVAFSFTIETDGKVTDIALLDYAGHKGFIKTGRRALSQWQYERTEIEGKNLVPCEGLSVRLDFTIESGNQGEVYQAGEAFKKSYAEIEQLISDGLLPEAQKKMLALKNYRLFSQVETAWYGLLESHYYQATGDIQAQISSLIVATNVSDDGYLNGNQYLDDNNYTLALYDLFMLELGQKQYYRALTSVHYLIKAAGEHDKDWIKGLSESKEKILYLINSDRTIKVPGKIAKDKPWHHKLVRQSFAIENIQGQLAEVDVNCESYQQKYQLAEGVAVKIPDDVHFCSVVIQGESDAVFELWELANH